MNDHFKIIYKILRTLEKAMDMSEFDISQISYTQLEISKERWAKYIEMMADAEYIKGVRVYQNLLGETLVDDLGIKITLKGLEYLCENTIMQRMYKTAKGITDLVK